MSSRSDMIPYFNSARHQGTENSPSGGNRVESRAPLRYHARMSPGKRFRRNDALPCQEIQGQAVIVCPARRELHQLDETATFLWNRLDRPRSAAELAEALCEEFEVDPERAERDTRAFLAELQRKGLAHPA